MPMTSWTRSRVSVPGGQGFDRCVLDASKPGLRVVVFGGTHGDEIEGILAANRLAAADIALVSGRLEIVPIVHEAAFRADSRTSPLDGGTLARAFPGDPAGTPTQRLADALYRQVLAGADLLIDLHTSGQTYDIPFLAGYIDDGRDRRGLGARAAQAFGADFVWRHDARAPGRTISDMDAAIYTEAPLAGPTDLGFVDRYVDGVYRVLAELGMIARHAAPPPAATPSIAIASGGDVDKDLQVATVAGLFIHKARQADVVRKGQLLGQVIDLAGKVLQELRAPHDGWVVVLKRRPHVMPGDALVGVAVADRGG
jgi:predicted deacylase